MVIEVINKRRCSGKGNKLRYIYTIYQWNKISYTSMPIGTIILPELVYKFRNILDRTDFSHQSRKVIIEVTNVLALF